MSDSGGTSAGLSKYRSVNVWAGWNDGLASSDLGPDLFEEIYRSHAELVRRVCLRALRDPSEAEDATQDVFVRVLQKLHTFRGEAAFSSWLYRLTMNVVLMRFRKNRKSAYGRSVSLDEVGEVEIKAGRGSRELTPHPSNVLDRIDLHTAINQLPSRIRKVLILHDIEGYRHREIAEFLGYSDGNSKCQLHRAHVRLRKLLKRRSTNQN